MKKTSSYDVYSFILNGISRTHKVLAASMILTGALMCGCSDNEIVENNELTPEPQVAKREGVVTVGSNPNDPELMKRITFFGNNGARSATDEVDLSDSFGVEPRIPSTIKEYPTPTDQIKDENYVLTGGGTSGSQLQVNNGGKVYIKGNVGATTVKGRGTIYVLSGSKLTLYDGNIENGDITIKAFGGVCTEGKLTLGCNAKLFVKQNLSIQGKLQINAGWDENNRGGTCVVEGSFNGQDITLGADSKLLVKKDAFVKGELAIDGGWGNIKGGICVVDNSLQVENNLKIGNGALVDAYCIEVLSEADQAINVEGRLNIRNYLAADFLYLNGGSVYFWPNAMAEIVGTTQFSQDKGGLFYSSSSEGVTDHALLRTGILTANGISADKVKNMFESNLKAVWESKRGELEKADIESRTDYYIEKGGCNPGNGKQDDGNDQKPDDQKSDEPTPEKPEDKPTVTPIAIIEGPEADTGTHGHTHLSATCIQAVGEKAYVSWHLNTEYKDNESWDETSQHMGCAEMYTVTESYATINSWLMNNDFDFNHLLVDNGKAYFVGDTKYYGATLGVIDLKDDGTFGRHTETYGKEEKMMPYYSLYKDEEGKGTSGNCMVRDGNYYRIASYKGFQSFSVATLRSGDKPKQTGIIPTTGSAKHIAMDKDGNYIATLHLDQKKVDASTATITVYKSGSWGENVVQTITVDGDQIITPIDGKNVIAIDGEFVYVALGQNGVAKYSITDGHLEEQYNYNKDSKSPDAKKKPLANGLCVDENYVYVANGAAGLIVLDKKTMEKVTSWRRTSAVDGKKKSYSANYVQKVGNLIYIAYGRDGLEVVKLGTPSSEN